MTRTDLAALALALPDRGRWYIVDDCERPISWLELEACNDPETLDEIRPLRPGESTIVGTADRVMRIQ